MWWNIFFLLIHCLETINSVRITQLQVPEHAAEGDSALLGCRFDLEGDTLYYVKWYKDDKEFYRYVPYDDPPVASFPLAGVNVDVNRSDMHMVTLINLTQESSGIYKCEISGESPHFELADAQKYIVIYLLPSSPPQLSGLKKNYRIYDQVSVNCSSPASRPETHLRWWLNGRPAPKAYLRGPWYRLLPERSEAIETILEINFVALPEHFQSRLVLKCQAVIPPMFQEESTGISEEYVYSTVDSFLEPLTRAPDATEAVTSPDYKTDSSSSLQTENRLCSVLLVCNILYYVFRF